MTRVPHDVETYWADRGPTLNSPDKFVSTPSSSIKRHRNPLSSFRHSARDKTSLLCVYYVSLQITYQNIKQLNKE